MGLDHRSIQSATVKDITVLRKYVGARLGHIKKNLQVYEDREKRSRIGMEARCQVLGGYLEKKGGFKSGHFKEEFAQEARKRLRAHYEKKAAEGAQHRLKHKAVDMYQPWLDRNASNENEDTCKNKSVELQATA